MISIRRYLQDDRETDNALLRLAQLLIEGVAGSAVEGAESAPLHESTQQVLAALESGAPAAEVLEHATQAMDALKRHNQDVVECLRRPVAELQLKVKLLTAAITAISSTSDATIGRLRQIKGQLLSAVSAREIHSLKAHLSECLDGVLAEAQRQREESDRAAVCLNRSAIQPLNPPGAGHPVPVADPATGLPTRDRAEEAIAQACQDEAPAFVVVMAINQLQTLNRSFGTQVGNAILQRFAVLVRDQLPAIDQLFRWSGPTIVSLVRRRSAYEVRGAIQPILARNLGHTVKTLSGDVHVPISSRWIVLPLMASPRMLFHKIDGFSASN